jgi:hypothetical protein
LLDVFVLGEREEKRRIEKGGKKEGNETIEERERIPYPSLLLISSIPSTYRYQ